MTFNKLSFEIYYLILLLRDELASCSNCGICQTFTPEQ